MPGILIVAHTPIAGAMLGFIEHTYGELPVRVAAVKSAAGILVLTDLMGATPANVASRLTKPGIVDCKVLVLAGINLPMLMRAISYRADGLESLALKALQGGQNGIIRLGAPPINVELAINEKAGDS
jgi:PTS system mannose-specific IIA component